MAYFLFFVCSFAGCLFADFLLGMVNFFLKKRSLKKKQPKQPNYRR